MRSFSGIFGFLVLAGCAGGSRTARPETPKSDLLRPTVESHVAPSGSSDDASPPPPDSLPEEASARAPLRFDLAKEQTIALLAARGQWFLRCDASANSIEPLALVPVSEDGPATTIALEKLLGHSKDGRFAAYETNGKAFVFDSEGRRAFEIPRANDSERPLVAAFSEDEKRLALLENGGLRIVLYDLGKEGLRFLERFDLPLAAFSLEATRSGFVGRWTNERTLFDVETCLRAGFPGHYAGKLALARREHDVVRFRTKSDLRVAPGFIAELPSGDLERLPDGTLGKFFEGKFTPLLDHKCGARLLGGDSDKEQLAFVCEEHATVPREEGKKSEKQKKKVRLKFPIVVWDGSKSIPLGIETMRTGVDIPPLPGQRFVTMRIGAKSTLLDVEKAVAISLEKGAVVATFGQEVLTRDGLDFSRRSDGKKLLSLDTPFSPFLVAGPSVSTTKIWIDFSAPENSVSLGDEEPLLLTPEGALLTKLPSDDARTFLLRRMPKPSAERGFLAPYSDHHLW